MEDSCGEGGRSKSVREKEKKERSRCFVLEREMKV